MGTLSLTVLGTLWKLRSRRNLIARLSTSPRYPVKIRPTEALYLRRFFDFLGADQFGGSFSEASCHAGAVLGVVVLIRDEGLARFMGRRLSVYIYMHK